MENRTESSLAMPVQSGHFFKMVKSCPGQIYPNPFPVRPELLISRTLDKLLYMSKYALPKGRLNGSSLALSNSNKLRFLNRGPDKKHSCGLRNILMCCNFVIKYGQRNDIYWSLSRLTYLVISILHKTYLLNYKSCCIYFKIDFEIYKIGNMSNVGPLELPHPGLVEVM